MLLLANCVRGRPLCHRCCCTPNPAMQTKEGHKAKGATSHEVTEIMKQIREEAEKPENMVHLARGEQWLYSWNNDKIHKGADMWQMDSQHTYVAMLCPTAAEECWHWMH